MQKLSLTPPILETEAALLRSFLRTLRAENKRQATLDLYETSTRLFLEFARRENLPEVREISREHVEMWLESLYGTRAPASVRSYYMGVRAFFRWLLREDEITRSPMDRIKPPVLDETTKDIVSVEDMAHVLSFLEKQRRWRDCAIIAVLYDTGMRAGEVVDALTDECNLDTGLIVIPKTKGRRVRTVRIGPRAIRYVDRYLRTVRRDPTYLFNGRRGQLSKAGLYHIIRHCFAQAGVKGTIGTHDLRHTSATHVAGEMSERDMMTLYGWQNSTMARHYARAALEQTALKAHETASPMERLPRTK